MKLNKLQSLDSYGQILVNLNSSNNDINTSHSLHRCLVPAREEEIPLLYKPYIARSCERVFKKETSVFKDWKEDEPKMLERAFNRDVECWKVERFIKDGLARKDVEDALLEYFPALKSIFLALASRSGYPCITWL